MGWTDAIGGVSDIIGVFEAFGFWHGLVVIVGICIIAWGHLVLVVIYKPKTLWIFLSTILMLVLVLAFALGYAVLIGKL